MEKKLLDHKIAILFLAHAGITQPAWWSEWMTEIPSVGQHILLYVATQDRKLVPRSTHGEKGVTWHWVPLSYPTYWCDISQVLALQDGLRKILKDDVKKEVSSVYFISGAEVPVVSAWKLLHEPDITRIAVGLLTWMKGEMKTVPTMKDWMELREFLNAFHPAALSLNREDAERLAQFSRDKLEKLIEVLHSSPTVNQDYEAILDQMLDEEKELHSFYKNNRKALELDPSNRYLQARTNLQEANLLQYRRQYEMLKATQERSKLKTRPATCPDEILPFIILILLGKNWQEIQRKRITREFRDTTSEFHEVMSPLTFSDWKSPFLIPRPSGKDKNYPGKTFKQLVEEACQDQYFFLRKVGADLPYSGQKPWHCAEKKRDTEIHTNSSVGSSGHRVSSSARKSFGSLPKFSAS